MRILAYFTQDGDPKTGLTPTIKIVELSSNSVIVNEETMSETAIPGSYQYNFTNYNVYNDYAIRCDGGPTLSNYERYTYGANDYVSLSDMEDSLEDSDGSIG